MIIKPFFIPIDFSLLFLSITERGALKSERIVEDLSIS